MIPGEVHIRYIGDPPIAQQDEPQKAESETSPARDYTAEEQLANKRIAGARRWRR